MRFASAGLPGLTFGTAFWLTVSGALAPPAAAETFAAWLQGVRAEAKAAGISEGTLSVALDGLQPNPKVIELDRRQPEFTESFWTYLDKRVSETRITRGRDLLAKHRGLLEEIERKYGVQPRFLVTFWGLETNFGGYMGTFPTIQSLATLAHDPRRSDFFRTQLLAALKIVDDGHITSDAMIGSWAGAMGQPQFMPTTFKRHAVDHDGDGWRDIWTTLPDVFASAAKFLKTAGWRGDQTWGREVKLPQGFDFALEGKQTRKSLAEWQALGVRRIDGSDLPTPPGFSASVIAPSGAKGPAFLTYQNFRSTLSWNNSVLYAISVGHLSDRIAGGGPLRTPRSDDLQPLSRAQVTEIQTLLASRGLNPGPADGVLGSQTKAAIKAFQRSRELPPDGHADLAVLDALRDHGR